jgi:energy-coupling factor transporter ATP-binding protein EcfA2
VIVTPHVNAACCSNPFATRFVRPGSLEYRFREVKDSATEFADIVRRLDQDRIGLIVGPHGSGKTTLLHSLGPILSERFAKISSVQLFAPQAASASSKLESGACFQLAKADSSQAGSVRHLNNPKNKPDQGTRRALERVFARLIHARCMKTLVFSQQARLSDGGLLIVDGAEQLWRGDLGRLLRRIGRRGQSVLATSHAPLRGMPVLRETETDGDLVQSLTQSLLAHASPHVIEVVQQELCKQDWSTLTNVRDFWFDLYDVVQPYMLQPHGKPEPTTLATGLT